MLEMFGMGMPRILMDKDDGGGSGGDDPGKNPDEPGKDPGSEDPGKDDKSDREKKLEKELEEKSSEIENLKKQQAGEYKRGKDLQKQIDELKKAQMTEDERKKAEEEERQKKDEEARGQFLGECVTLAAERSGVKEEDHFLLFGKDQEEIFKKGARLKELIAEADQAGYDRAMKDKTKGKPPAGGENPGGGDKPPKLGETTLDSLNALK